MDYLRIYNNIINRAKSRTLKGYYENHHIVPKCMGGTDEDGVVALTAKEHFLCHLLLVEIHPQNKKLKYAVWAMANQLKYRDYKISSRVYARLKIQASEAKKKRTKCYCTYCGQQIERTPSTMREFNYCNRICYLQAGGVSKGEVHIYKGTDRLFIPTNKVTEYIKEGWKQGRPGLQKKVQQLTKEGNIIKQYNSVKEAVAAGFNVTGISQCATGNRRTHKGFVWKYIN